VRVVREGDVDLVAMCTHGKGADGQSALGSVAVSMLQRVSVPMLMLKPGVTVVED